VNCALQKEQANSASSMKNSGSTIQSETDKEFYSKDKYATVQDALTIFQDDDLMSKPGKTKLNSMV
jgi:hypothetical protein